MLSEPATRAGLWGLLAVSSQVHYDEMVKGVQQSEHEVFYDVSTFEEDWETKAIEKLRSQVTKRRCEYDLSSYEQNASRNWNVFYKRNTTRFFRDRHYLLKAFPLLKESLQSNRKTNVMEVGCGVGNTILPLTRQYQNCFGYGIDFAASAIDLLNASAVNTRCQGFVCDVSKTDCVLPKDIPLVDFASLVFVLSAVAPENMKTVVENVKSRVRPGGYVLFRDYGEMDQAQLRFDDSQRLGHNYYVRQDGTRSFFFTMEGLSWLFENDCGLVCVDSEVIKRVVSNRKSQLQMSKLWIFCEFPF